MLFSTQKNIMKHWRRCACLWTRFHHSLLLARLLFNTHIYWHKNSCIHRVRRRRPFNNVMVNSIYINDGNETQTHSNNHNFPESIVRYQKILHTTIWIVQNNDPLFYPDCRLRTTTRAVGDTRKSFIAVCPLLDWSWGLEQCNAAHRARTSQIE